MTMKIELYAILLYYLDFTSDLVNGMSNDIRNNKLQRHKAATETMGTSCKSFTYVTKRQRHLCRKYPDVMEVVFKGIQSAAEECRHQFRQHRWNCNMLTGESGNPLKSAMFYKGYKETAFAHALVSSAIVHHVARACALGELTSCSCDVKSKDKTRDHRWAGCDHNVHFAAKFARKFLDGRQKARDLLSFIHSHNSKVGRALVRREMKLTCKCHGMSGSCEFKTCWRAVAELRTLGDMLKAKYDNALDVEVMNNANGILLQPKVYADWDTSPSRKPSDLDLVYGETSPNFCSPIPSLDYGGISGRPCQRGTSGPDSCFNLCCGRGYNTMEVVETKRCQCEFKWCCQVICQKCSQVISVHTCK